MNQSNDASYTANVVDNSISVGQMKPNIAQETQQRAIEF